MVEVFKTDVKDHDLALILIDQIHETFAGYRANFDLDDCDRILRVCHAAGTVNAPQLIALLNKFGFHAEILNDDHSPATTPRYCYTAMLKLRTAENSATRMASGIK